VTAAGTKARATAVEQRHTPDEAAALMRVNKETILRAIRAGDLKAKKQGRGYRIKGSDLEHWYDGWEDA
jgi:excisionase family DNA binding protein